MSVVTNGVEYSTPFHPSDGMMWNIPHHFVQREAVVSLTIECYVSTQFFNIKQIRNSKPLA